MTTSSLFKVSDNVFEHVLNQLNYSSVNSFDEDVQKLTEWMQTQPHFPEIMDEKKIQNFLILNKGSVERTKQKIDNYYTIRSQMPEIFGNNHSKHPISNTMEEFYMIPLPKLSKDMYRVFHIKVRDKVLINNFDPIVGVRFLVNLAEIRLLEDITYGDVLILDGESVPFSIVSKLTPSLLYKALVAVYKKTFSNRMKALYIVNAPPFVDIILNVLKPILREKIFNRIHIVKNYAILCERVGKEVLPKDCGGEEKNLDELQEILQKKFQDYKHYLDRLSGLRTNEDLRPESLKNEEMFGFYGNFKKLDID